MRVEYTRCAHRSVSCVIASDGEELGTSTLILTAVSCTSTLILNAAW